MSDNIKNTHEHTQQYSVFQVVSHITDVRPTFPLIVSAFFLLSLVDMHWSWLLPFTFMEREPHLVHQRERERARRQEDRRSRKCLKAQETPKNYFHRWNSHQPSPTSLTAHPTHTLKHLYSRAHLLMVLPVNYLPMEMQEQSNWKEGSCIGDKTPSNPTLHPPPCMINAFPSM